jgi:hypothetical protein
MRAENTVARAFELARSGRCQSISEIHQQLKAEGYDKVAEHFSSGALKKQLNALMKPA